MIERDLFGRTVLVRHWVGGSLPTFPCASGATHEIIQPAGTSMYASFQAACLRRARMLIWAVRAVTDEVDGDLAQDRQVARCRPIPNAAVIFSEGDIQDPMEPIFYGPMPADCLDQDLGVIAAKPPSTVSIKRPCGVVVSAQVSFSERKPACLSVIAARV